MDALQAILSRRSTRAFKPELPSEELIQQIIEAGRAAPSGSNSQTTHFIVITSPSVLENLRTLVHETFAGMEADENTYVSLRNSITRSKTGSYVYDYHAPVLIVTANRKDYGNALADSACALENMMIAANHFDLGSCWINQLHWLTDEPAVRDYLCTLGLLEEETVTGALALGIPASGEPERTPLPRYGNPVTWIG